jgi:hypothetical protein
VLRIISTIIILLLGFAFSLKTLVLIQFEINRAYIEKELCEQRQEVNNCCKGNCYLIKQLQNTTAAEHPMRPAFPEQEELVFEVESTKLETFAGFIASRFLKPVNEYSHYLTHLGLTFRSPIV